MKTITLIIAASLTVFSFVSPEPTVNLKSTIENQKGITIKTKGKKVDVEVDIEIGRKKHGCTGIGVCKITVSAGIKGGDGSPIRAVPYVADGKIVALEFIKIEGDKAKEVLKNLEAGYFIMEEGFQAALKFNGEDAKRWKVEEGETLKMDWPEGKYKAGKTEKGWIVIQS